MTPGIEEFATPMIRRTMSLVVLLCPIVGLAAGCDSANQQYPLAKVADPPQLPKQDKSKIKVPLGHSPDVLPQ